MNENRSDAAGLTEACAQAAPGPEAPVDSLHTYAIFTDGAVIGNPGPAGWGVVALRSDGRRKQVSGGLPFATNQQMELMAAIEGLKLLKPCAVGTIFTDSKYVVQSVHVWRANWQANGWRTASGASVKNAELFRQLFALFDARPGLRFEWVKGHADNPHNKSADRLARKAAVTMQTNGASKLATSLEATA